MRASSYATRGEDSDDETVTRESQTASSKQHTRRGANYATTRGTRIHDPKTKRRDEQKVRNADRPSEQVTSAQATPRRDTFRNAFRTRIRSSMRRSAVATMKREGS